MADRDRALEQALRAARVAPDSWAENVRIVGERVGHASAIQHGSAEQGRLARKR